MFDSATTKGNILNAAAKIFTSKGYRDAKTKDIAVEAKTSEALLFKYFRTKHDLYVEFVKEEIRRRLPESEQYFGSKSNPIDLLYRFGHDLLYKNDETPEFIRFFSEMLQLQNSYFVMKESATSSIDIVDLFLTPIIQKGQEAGEVKTGDARIKAEIYWCFILGSTLGNSNFPEKINPAIFDELHRLLFVKD